MPISAPTLVVKNTFCSSSLCAAQTSLVANEGRGGGGGASLRLAKGVVLGPRTGHYVSDIGRLPPTQGFSVLDLMLLVTVSAFILAAAAGCL